MNYGKKGIRKAQKSLTSKSVKFKKMFFISVLKLLIVGIIAMGIFGICFGIGAYKGILYSAPSISNVKVIPTGYATVVYDSKGNETTKLVAANSNRIQVSMDKIPKNLSNAFVAIEDERFYSHNGIDIQAIGRSGYRAIITGFKKKEGASTITQQLIKNNVFDDWGSSDIQMIKRKIQEQYLAIELEKVMTKEEILEVYMNSINLGQNTLGVQAASMRYFNKSVSQLTLSECAAIAGITKNPSKLNPISHPEKNNERRLDVLNKMLELEFITQQEYDEAVADDVYSRIESANKEVESNSVYTYFEDALIEQVYNDLIDLKGYSDNQAYSLVYSGGLSIFSTLDPDIQKTCDEVFSNEENYPKKTQWYLNYALTIIKADETKENHSKEMFKAYFKTKDSSFNLLYPTKDEAYAAIEEYKAAVMEEGDEVEGERINLTPQPQVSITVEDQSTGYIVAMVGGRGVKEASRTLNRAYTTYRQPGSTFKVLSTYAPALDSAGLTLATVQNDAPYTYANGRPVKNWWGDSYEGLQSLRWAIMRSANVITVKTLTQISPQLGFDYLKNFGFTTLVERRVQKDNTVVSDIGQPLALGGITDGVTNMELNAAYAAIANQGTYVKPKLYTKILDHDGNVLIDNTTPETTQVIKESTAWLLTSAMKDVVYGARGTAGSVSFPNMDIAGKTGTTTDYKDVWFSGFTPYYTATVWTGIDNNAKLSTNDEKNLSKKLWKEVMSRVHAELPQKSFPMASGIVTAQVCSKSGKLPIAGVCDGCVVTEYFAEGTVPTSSCDVHSYSTICSYTTAFTGQQYIASDLCPFKQATIVERIPERLQDSAINSGLNKLNIYNNALDNLPDEEEPQEGEDGLESTTDITTMTSDPSQMCPHNAAFFTAPNANDVIERQRNELYTLMEQLNQIQQQTP